MALEVGQPGESDVSLFQGRHANILAMTMVASLAELESLVRQANQGQPSEQEDAEVMAEVRRFAASDAGFEQWLSALPRELLGIRNMVYEALAPEAERFETLLIRELAEAIALAPTFPNPADVLYPFLEYVVLCETKLRPKVREMLAPLLCAAHPVSRRIGLNLIVDFLEPTDRSFIRLIWPLLKEDPDWRVRFAAWEALSELGDLPQGYQLPLLDRLRAKFLSPRKY